MEKKKPTKFDISIFEKNEQNEFVALIKKNRLRTTKAFNDFLLGLKNEASDTKETSRIIGHFLLKQKISKEEEKHIKKQVANIFKIVGIGVPFMIIPGATILIPFLLKAAEKKGIDLYPSNFKEKKNNNITNNL